MNGITAGRFSPCETADCKARCDNFGVYCEEICIDEIERLRKAAAKYIEQADRVGSIGWKPYDEFRAAVTVPNG